MTGEIFGTSSGAFHGKGGAALLRVKAGAALRDVVWGANFTWKNRQVYTYPSTRGAFGGQIIRVVESYDLKVVASDALANSPERALTGWRVSDVVVVDRTAPLVEVLGVAERGQGDDPGMAAAGDHGGTVRRMTLGGKPVFRPPLCNIKGITIYVS